MNAAGVLSLPGESFRQTVERLVREGADLSGADLSGADLSGANLIRANLSGANLSGAMLDGEPLVWATTGWSDHGECGRTLTGLFDGEHILLSCGCWSGTDADLRLFIDRGARCFAASRTLAMTFVIDRINDAIAARKAHTS